MKHNILIVMDTADSEIGDFNTTCYYRFLEYFNQKEHSPITILGEDISAEKVQNEIGAFNGNVFTFIAYSHGQEDSLHANNQTYVSLNNTYFFGSSIFYTVLCLTAKELGKSIVKDGNSLAFWGYEEEFLFTKENEERFADCANYGILKYFETNDIRMSYQEAKQYYTDEADKIDNFLLKSRLIANRNAMVLLQ